MKMLVYLLDLKDDAESVERYLDRHKNVIPQIPEKLEKMRIHQNRVCRLGNRLVNIYLVDDDFVPSGVEDYTEDEYCKRWDEEMRLYQQKIPGSAESEWWGLAETIFLFDRTGIK